MHSTGYSYFVILTPFFVVDREIQHNVSNCIFERNQQGAVEYLSAGEINPIITLDLNQIKHNCDKFYGNFTSCTSSVVFDIQNTQTLYFRNNLVESNEGGGVYLRCDSRGSATSLKAWIHNNLFFNNTNLPVMKVVGRQSSPYQEVVVYRNYFTQNYVRYDSVILLRQVLSNFTYNYIKSNWGLSILEVSGFDRVRLPIYQSTTHNGFYK